MHSDARRTGQLDRRSLLKGAGLVVGAAAASTAAATAEEAPAPAHGSRPQNAGYTETEHVRTYYKLARY